MMVIFLEMTIIFDSSDHRARIFDDETGPVRVILRLPILGRPLPKTGQSVFFRQIMSRQRKSPS